MDKSITELLGILKNTKNTIPQRNDVFMVQKGKGKHHGKAKPKFVGKGKGKSKPNIFKPKPRWLRRKREFAFIAMIRAIGKEIANST